MRRDPARSARLGEVKRMFVRPDQRGKGVGVRGCSPSSRRWRSAAACLCCASQTGIHNREALALYPARRFTERGPFGDYASDPLSVFMEKRVNT